MPFLNFRRAFTARQVLSLKLSIRHHGRKCISACTGRRIAIIRDHTRAREGRPPVSLEADFLASQSPTGQGGNTRVRSRRRDAPWPLIAEYPRCEHRARTTDRRLAIVVPAPSASHAAELDATPYSARKIERDRDTCAPHVSRSSATRIFFRKEDKRQISGSRMASRARERKRIPRTVLFEDDA